MSQRKEKKGNLFGAPRRPACGERDLGGGGGVCTFTFFQKWLKNFFVHLHHSHLAHLVRFCVEKKREENFSALRAVQPVEKET